MSDKQKVNSKKLKKIQKSSRTVASVAGDAYSAVSPRVSQRRMQLSAEYSTALKRAAKINLGDSSSLSRLHPDVASAIQSMRLKAQNLFPETAGNDAPDHINLYTDVMPFCLEEDDSALPVAERLLYKNGEMSSIKLKNIRFQLTKLFPLLMDFILYANNFSEKDAISVICGALMLVYNTIYAIKIELTQDQGAILWMIYHYHLARKPLNEENLYSEIAQNYPEMENVKKKVEYLIEIGCICLLDGDVQLAEKI